MNLKYVWIDFYALANIAGRADYELPPTSGEAKKAEYASKWGSKPTAHGLNRCPN